MTTRRRGEPDPRPFPLSEERPELAALRHSTIAREVVAGAVLPLEACRALAERDRRSLLAQFAAHAALVRFAGARAGRFHPGSWIAVRRRGSDPRLVRIAPPAGPDEPDGLEAMAELLGLAELESLSGCWQKPDCVYAELDRSLRSGGANRTWARKAAAGALLPPGTAVLRALLGGAPQRWLCPDRNAIDAVTPLFAAGLLDGAVVGGEGSSPLRSGSAIRALAGTAARGETLAEALCTRFGRTGRPAAIVIDTPERFDAGSAQTLRALAAGCERIHWIAIGSVPPFLTAAGPFAECGPAEPWLVSPSLRAWSDLRRRLPHETDFSPLVETAALDAWLDHGIAPPLGGGGADTIQEPRRSWLGAVSLCGRDVPLEAAQAVLERLGARWDSAMLIADGVAIDDRSLRFEEEALHRGVEASLPAESLPVLRRIAAEAMRESHPARAAALYLHGGDLDAAESMLAGLTLEDDAAAEELLTALSLVRLTGHPRLGELRARLLLQRGRYRAARDEAGALASPARDRLQALAERRMGHYAAARAASESAIAAGDEPASVLAAELARIDGRSDEARGILERCAGDDPEANWQRALLDLEAGVPFPEPLHPHHRSRLESYRASLLGETLKACEAARVAAAQAPSLPDRIDASLDLMFALFLAGSWDEAKVVARETLALVEETEGDRAAGGVLFTLAWLAADAGEWSAAARTLERLRGYYQRNGDTIRLRETALVSAHLAFCRGQLDEARREARSLDVESLSAEEREAALLILDEIDWMEGVLTAVRSRGDSACVALTDRYRLLAMRAGQSAPLPADSFLRALVTWEREALARRSAGDPPAAATRSQRLALLRSLRGIGRLLGQRIPLADDLARELGIEPLSAGGDGAAARELEILQRVATLPFPFLPSDLSGARWSYCERNRLGGWSSIGSTEVLSDERLDELLEAPEGEWIRCSETSLLRFEGIGAWTEGSRTSLASLFRIRAEHHRFRRVIDEEVSEASPRPLDAEGIVGASPAMADVLARVARVARRDVPVCIEGESGSGKELIARALHRASPRRTRPFLAINCAALPEALVESELFGHVRGAFTGADRDKPGLIEAADGGTLFLDEIGELPQGAQAKLLRFLQEGELRRVGEQVTRRADVRIVAATNRNLEAEVEAGRFREDLYYRVRGVDVRVPPLRERGSDILLLARHFLEEEHRRNRGASRFDDEAVAVLAAWEWPGNVRELRHTIQAAHALAGEGRFIGLEHLPPRMQKARTVKRPPAGFFEEVVRFRRTLVEQSLKSCNGNQSQAARLLGISRQALAYQIRELGIVIKKH